MDKLAEKHTSQSGLLSDTKTGTPRACDQCRARKVRCDKETPCSNCRVAGRLCSASPSQSRKEPRQRVLISSQYEKKIDRIEERLGSIEKLLRELTPTLPAQPVLTDTAFAPGPTRSPHGRFTPASCGSSPSASTVDGRDDDSSPAYEGHSSMSAQAAWASNFLEDAVQRTSLRDTSPSIDEALSSLRKIVEMQHNLPSAAESMFSHRKKLPPNGLKGLEMPPVDSVVAALRMVKEKPPFFCMIIFWFVSVQDFSDLCKEVFFATEEYSEATFIIVNTGLYFMFSELAAGCDDTKTRKVYKRYCDLSQSNVETCLAQLNLFQPAKVEIIEALLTATAYAINVYKPSMAWVLVSQAAHLCQSMGLHQCSHDKDDERTRSRKTRAFWLIFMLDKGLSLRLGRHPILHHIDVTTPSTDLCLNAPEPWRVLLQGWVKLSIVQGKTYEMLYSPAALCKPDQDRISCAWQLSNQVKCIIPREIMNYQAGCEEAGVEKCMKWLVRSDEVSYLSTLALIHRAIPPGPDSCSTFSADCITIAKRAIEVHTQCMAGFEAHEYLKTVYVHWTILYAPFVPLIVLFCHAVETSDKISLAILWSFAESLKSTAALSEGIAKLHRLVGVLYSVAVTYVEAKEKAMQDQSLSTIGSEFDVYLGQLGLIHPTDDATGNMVIFPDSHAGDGGLSSQTPPASGVTTTPGPSRGPLGGWFAGSKYMMKLLEEGGLTGFNGNEYWDTSMG